MATSARPSFHEATNVLVASHDDFFRRQVVRDLQTDSHFVEEALGGADALSKLETGRCRVLLLDRRLPDINPEEVTSVVESRFPGVEVVAIDSQCRRRRVDTVSRCR